jgi:hypothetical protein
MCRRGLSAQWRAISPCGRAIHARNEQAVIEFRSLTKVGVDGRLGYPPAGLIRSEDDV